MRLGWVILYVPDVAATVAFYEAAFGLRRRFVDPTGEFAEMETGATALAFAAETLAERNGVDFRPTRPGDAPPAVEVALVAEAVEDAYRGALDAGAAAVKAPAVKPWGQTVAYVRDNNGALVEIASPIA